MNMLTPIDYVIGNFVLILYTYYAWQTISQQTIQIKIKYLLLASALIMIFSIINFSLTAKLKKLGSIRPSLIFNCCAPKLFSKNLKFF